MSMKERLQIHRQIEAENRENIEAAAAWDRCTASEVREMIGEKDRAMEWDELSPRAQPGLPGALPQNQRRGRRHP